MKEKKMIIPMRISLQILKQKAIYMYMKNLVDLKQMSVETATSLSFDQSGQSWNLSTLVYDSIRAPLVYDKTCLPMCFSILLLTDAH